jgi:basic amino acid/polyamine antiporter, APA family
VRKMKLGEVRELSGRLGLVQYFTISVGAAIGVAWIPLVGEWLALAGSLGAALAFALGAVVICLVVLAYIQVGAAVPVSGGEVAYAEALFGIRAAFLIGWILSFIYIAMAAFEAISVGWITATLLPDIEGPVAYRILGSDVHWGSLLLGLSLAALFGWLHLRGTSSAALLQDLMTAAFFVVVAVFVTAGLLGGSRENLQPYFVIQTEGWAWSGIAAVFGMTPLFYAGFNFAAQAIGERAPNVTPRQIGFVLGLSVLCAAVFYVLVIIAAAAAAPRSVLLSAELPAAAAFQAALGSAWLGNTVLVAGLLGLLTTWNALIFAAARILHRLATAGLLPQFFGTVSANTGAPVGALVFVTAASMVGAFAGRGALGLIVSSAGIGIAAAYLSVCIGALKLPRTNSPGVATWSMSSLRWISVVAAALVTALILIEPFTSNPRVHLPNSWLVLGVWIAVGLMLQRRAEPVPGRG